VAGAGERQVLPTADEDELGYHVRCVNTQNQMLNAELLAMVLQRDKAVAKHELELKPITTLSRQLELVLSEQLELVHLVAGEATISDRLRAKCQALLERTAGTRKTGGGTGSTDGAGAGGGGGGGGGGQ
jgi:hypothetical protein